MSPIPPDGTRERLYPSPYDCRTPPRSCKRERGGVEARRGRRRCAARQVAQIAPWQSGRMARKEARMLRSRLLTFAGLVAAHAAASFATLWCFAFQTGPAELFCGVMFIPTILLLQLSEDPHHLPDLGALVGVPEDSPLATVLFL